MCAMCDTRPTGFVVAAVVVVVVVVVGARAAMEN